VSHPAPFRLTKIIGTIGPATLEPAMLVRLIEAGLRVVRLNFSHGSLTDHETHIQNIRAAAEQAATPIAILGDLSGPKIRTTQIEGGQLHLTEGEVVAFGEDVATGYRHEESQTVVLGTTYPPMIHEIEPGDRVMLDDGQLLLKARQRTEHPAGPRLVCDVIVGGPLSDKKGINLPDTELSLPAMTDYDRQCVQWALAEGVDYLALSFVRRAQDVSELLEYLQQIAPQTARKKQMPIIPKIETPQALNDLEAIVDVADGVMIARGDLGVELDPWHVPIVQKRIIRTAHDYGKPVIVATQMLQSMIESSTATRAEVSDVANAVVDGADAVMLSGETAVGQYPYEAVRIMARAAESAEAYNRENPTHRGPPRKLQESRYRTAALAHGVSVVVRDLGAKYVVMWSELGGGARYLSQNRLPVPILAVSSLTTTLRQMSLMFGVRPIAMQRPTSVHEFLEQIDAMMLDNGWAEKGDPIVIALGEPLGIPGVTNEIRIHYIGDVARIRWHPKTE
jgi:pyruvate kinase